MSSVNVQYLANYQPIIRDQGVFPTCAAETFASALEYTYYQKYGEVVFFSRDSIFANPALNNFSSVGMVPRRLFSGATLTTGVPEKMMPSVERGGEKAIIDNYNNSVTDEIREESKKYTITSFHIDYQVDDEFEKVKLALENPDIFTLPILNFKTYDSFYDGRLDPVLKQITDDDEIRGGSHAMLVIGIGDIEGKPYYIMQNSWGDDWGQDGICFMPIDYKAIMNIAFATISLNDFGKHPKDIEETYLLDVMPKVADIDKYTLYNHSTLSKPRKTIKDIHFDTLVYVEESNRISSVTITNNSTGEFITSTNIKVVNGLTEVEFDRIITMEKDVEYNIYIEGSSHIRPITTSVELPTGKPREYSDNVFYLNSIFNVADAIQGFYISEGVNIVKEVKIELLEKTDGGYIKKNPITTIDAVEGLEGRLDELKKSVSDGKSKVADSITQKGVATESIDSFDTMANNILQIEGEGGGDYNIGDFISEENVERFDDSTEVTYRYFGTEDWRLESSLDSGVASCLNLKDNTYIADSYGYLKRVTQYGVEPLDDDIARVSLSVANNKLYYAKKNIGIIEYSPKTKSKKTIIEGDFLDVDAYDNFIIALHSSGKVSLYEDLKEINALNNVNSITRVFAGSKDVFYIIINQETIRIMDSNLLTVETVFSRIGDISKSGGNLYILDNPRNTAYIKRIGSGGVIWDKKIDNISQASMAVDVDGSVYLKGINAFWKLNKYGEEEWSKEIDDMRSVCGTAGNRRIVFVDEEGISQLFHEVSGYYIRG